MARHTFGPLPIRSHILHALYVDQLSLFLFPYKTLYSLALSSEPIAGGAGRGFLLAAYCRFACRDHLLQLESVQEGNVNALAGASVSPTRKVPNTLRN